VKLGRAVIPAKAGIQPFGGCRLVLPVTHELRGCSHWGYRAQDPGFRSAPHGYRTGGGIHAGNY